MTRKSWGEKSKQNMEHAATWRPGSRGATPPSHPPTPRLFCSAAWHRQPHTTPRARPPRRLAWPACPPCCLALAQDTGRIKALAAEVQAAMQAFWAAPFPGPQQQHLHPAAAEAGGSSRLIMLVGCLVSSAPGGGGGGRRGWSTAWCGSGLRPGAAAEQVRDGPRLPAHRVAPPVPAPALASAGAALCCAHRLLYHAARTPLSPTILQQPTSPAAPSC